MKHQFQQMNSSRSGPREGSETAPTTLLILGHPSHELRVYEWLLRTKPMVFVLTDGSANRGFKVCEHTAAYLDATGIKRGSLFGAFPDKDFYQHIRSQHFDFFRSIVRHLSEEMMAEHVELVAGDSIEGFNPTHDLCRLMIDAAVMVAKKRRAKPLRNYEFALVGPVQPRPDELSRMPAGEILLFSLSEEMRSQKIDFAKRYPGVSEDVARQLAAHGELAFGTECLYPSDESRLFRDLFVKKPPYELYGEERVKSGLYDSVLRYVEHVKPVQENLAAYVREEGGATK